MEEEKIHKRSATAEGLHGNLLILREYARRVMVEEDADLASLGNLMGDMMREYLLQGECFKLTQRDLVVLLYKGVLY